MFQEFDFEVLYKSGRQNVIADHLSRLRYGRTCHSVFRTRLADAQLFAVQDDWMQPLLNYLRSGVTLSHLPKDQRQKLAIQALPYTLICEQLYKLGANGILR